MLLRIVILFFCSIIAIGTGILGKKKFVSKVFFYGILTMKMVKLLGYLE